MNVVYICGCPRSGTSHLQWLLKTNFKDIIIITSLKHFEPYSFLNLIDWNGNGGDLDFNSDKVCDFISRLGPNDNIDGPAALITSDVFTKKMEEDELKQNVINSILNGSTKFLLSIKDVYSFYMSETRSREINPFPIIPDIVNYWNSLNESWISFINKNPSCGKIIKHEKMLFDSDVKYNLNSIKNDFCFSTISNEYILTQKDVRCYTVLSKKNFNRDYYINKRYMDEFTTEDKKIIFAIASKTISNFLKDEK